MTVDNGFLFDSVHKAVLARLAGLYGSTYDVSNVLFTATHSHAGVGGASHHLLYNASTLGFRQRNYTAP